MEIWAHRFGATTWVCIVWVIILASCSSQSLPSGAVGVANHYSYSPSVLQNGNVRQVWWCGYGTNPITLNTTDAIYYESINLSTSESSSPIIVLAETPRSWDAAYTCNPKVVGGLFSNPLGDGKTYGYAMYYVGTNNAVTNSIGVAFSNDGMTWKKYPRPVIAPEIVIGYGVGQPAVYNTDHKSGIAMFYEDNNPMTHHVAAISTDGVHFQVQGTVVTNGLDPDTPNPTWGDMAYDEEAGEWYAVFNRGVRAPSTTGNVVERGQYGVQLYKIAHGSLLTGSSPWEQLIIADTNATGFESNFIAGFVRDLYGSVNVAGYPNITMYTSVSYPPPDWNATPEDAGNSASIASWILLPIVWKPGQAAAVPFSRYSNGSVHEVTTGWVASNFHLESRLGHLYASPTNGASTKFYACDAGSGDYFVSLDLDCEGQRILGTQGYAYTGPIAGLNLVAVYRCRSAQDHFVSRDANCEGQTTDELLGYILP